MDKPKGQDTVMRRKYWQLARKSVDEFFEDSPFQLAAALSFYTVLSLSPLVLTARGESREGHLSGEPTLQKRAISYGSRGSQLPWETFTTGC